MTLPTTQHAERQPMPAKWISKIFAELQGNYGSRFLSMWATGESLPDGTDAGLTIAMKVWAQKLAGFADHPQAIKSVLESLPDDPPTLPQFVAMCRDRALKAGNSAPQIPYTPTAEDMKRQREAAQKVTEAAQRKQQIGDPMRWCRKPGSQIAMNAIVEEARARGNQVLAKVLEELIDSGICTQAGKLLKRWENGDWIKP